MLMLMLQGAGDRRATFGSFRIGAGDLRAVRGPARVSVLRARSLACRVGEKTLLKLKPTAVTPLFVGSWLCTKCRYVVWDRTVAELLLLFVGFGLGLTLLIKASHVNKRFGVT